MCNIRMIELRQYLALYLEACVHGDREGAAVHNLDGNLLFELGIRSLGKVDLAHPARTQGAQHPVRSYAISHHFQSMHPDKGYLQTSRSCGGVLDACMKAGALTATRRCIMPNGKEHKNPPPPTPPPGGTPPTGPSGPQPRDGNNQPPQIQLRRAAGVGGAVGGAVGGLIGALIGCCFCLQHLH
jgi:hypothetical protein